MADCPSLPKCPFFHDKMPSSPTIVNMMKKSYCQGDNSNCARWMVSQAKGGPAVPLDLFPNEREKAKKILAA